MALTTGDIAPDFTLPGTGGVSYTLSSYIGQPVVLVFYPGDNTPVCTEQLNTYTRGIGQFAEVGAQVLAISPQDVASHEGFAAAQGGFAFPLLADVERTVAREYGVIGPVGAYRRCVFVVGADGRLLYVHRAVAGMNFRPINEILEALHPPVVEGEHLA